MTDPLFNPGRRLYEQAAKQRRAKLLQLLRRIRREEARTP
jgi:hypothetical protein